LNMERSEDLFRVVKVEKYDEKYRPLSSYNYCTLSNEIVDMEPTILYDFVDKTINALNEYRNNINFLRKIDISAIKNDIDPKIYNIIVANKITNIYDLRKKIHRRYYGEIISYIPGIGKVKGEPIIKAMEEKGYMISLYTIGIK
jgi:hypothetical protein